jgi:ABC-type hemin transport system ATPase subunit
MELVSSFALLKQEIEMASSIDISSPVDMGKVQNKMGQPQEAVRSFRKALESKDLRQSRRLDVVNRSKRSMFGATQSGYLLNIVC